MIGKKSSWPNHFVQLQGALHTEASLDANTPILFSLLSMLHESNLRDVHCYTYQHFAPEWSINFIKWKVTSLWDISKFQMRNLYTSHYACNNQASYYFALLRCIFSGLVRTYTSNMERKRMIEIPNTSSSHKQFWWGLKRHIVQWDRKPFNICIPLGLSWP